MPDLALVAAAYKRAGRALVDPPLAKDRVSRSSHRPPEVYSLAGHRENRDRDRGAARR